MAQTHKDRDVKIKAFFDWAGEEIANGRARGDGGVEATKNAYRIEEGFRLLGEMYDRTKVK